MTTIDLGPKVCFIGNDGYMYCNYIVKKSGEIITGNGKYLKFLPTSFKFKGKIKDSSDGNQKESFIKA